jgi:porin
MRPPTLLLWAAFGLLGATAWAGPGNIPEKETPLLADWLCADGITSSWNRLRADLADHGLGFSGTYQAEGWGNTTGGLEQGTVYTGLLKFDLSFDLDKAYCWDGAKLSSTWLWLSGRNASADLVGNFLTISSIAGFNTLRMFELWFQQYLPIDGISLRVGQLAADSEFVISDYATTFLNSTFGWPAFMYENLPGGGPNYPVGTLGVRLAINPNDWFKFKSAVFQGNVLAQNVNLHGFRWRLDSQNGFFFLDEAQFRWNWQAINIGQPGQFKVGAWFNTAKFTQFDNDHMVRGNYGCYFILDQMLCPKPAKKEECPTPALTDCKGVAKATPDDTISKDGLGWFCRLGFEPQDRNFVGFYFDTGLAYKGLVPNRIQDTLGVAFAYAHLSPGARPTGFDEESAGVGAEMALELTYQAQITNCMIIQPDLQVILNPGGNQDLRNALVVGGQVSITF